jgi:hypothetical protein
LKPLPCALSGSAALADGICEKPPDTSPAELAAMTASLAAIMRELPGAPQGWLIDGEDIVYRNLQIARWPNVCWTAGQSRYALPPKYRVIFECGG